MHVVGRFAQWRVIEYHQLNFLEKEINILNPDDLFQIYMLIKINYTICKFKITM